MPLPNEQQVRKLIVERLASEMSVASDILEAATSILHPGRSLTITAERPGLVVAKVMGLLAKACKQFRAITELAQMGLDEPADGLSRMMFETMLAIMFLGRKDIQLRQGGEPVPILDGHQLTAVFRCHLYMANEAFQNRKLVNAHLRTPGLEQSIPEDSIKNGDEFATEMERAIGPEWTKRVKKRGYAGITIEELADSFGLAQVYATFYKITSGGVHAADSASHLAEMSPDATEFAFHVAPRPDDIPATLHTACVVMHEIISVVDEQFDLELTAKLNALSSGIEGMRVEFPTA